MRCEGVAISDRQRGLSERLTAGEPALYALKAWVDGFKLSAVEKGRRGEGARLPEQAWIDVCDFVHALSVGGEEVSPANRVPVLDYPFFQTL